jgi:hypothetical protein
MITFTLMSLVTSVKDYVEITHKLIEIEPLKNYTEFGAVFTYFIFSIGDFLKNFFSFSLFKNIWSIPIIIPDIASAMISEVSVLDGYFHNAFTFLETNIGRADAVNTTTNPSVVIFEKFMIGLINSVFLILPTSTSHLITLRRFVMQGLEAGYIAGLGTIAGNFLWLASIILGCRFLVIPWLSLDIFRYLLGFILLVKYIWDSSKERRMALEDLSKWKIFLLNFLLALTEQSCIYPFISNLSIGPDSSILEGFPVENYAQFLASHGAYLFGILLGSFSLLQFTCWFWENPAFSIYLWITTKSSLKISTSSYYKILNFTFLYATMLCAIASIPYYGLDYTITNPIGLVPQDRILNQKKSQSDPDKLITETAFLGVNPTDKNSRIRDGVHARRERWKQRLIKYQAFDASMYDQGVYDFLTIEDLNYGFDRFWLRRKMRNHQIRFRLFPGPWMRSLKKQLNNPANPSLESSSSGNYINKAGVSSNKSASGPRVEFFRILFEQFYHPNFHQANFLLKSNNNTSTQGKDNISQSSFSQGNFKVNNEPFTINTNSNMSKLIAHNNQLPENLQSTVPKNLQTKSTLKPGLIYSNSALRKFVRNVNTRMNFKTLNKKQKNLTEKYKSELIYSKRWKSLFSKIQPLAKTKTRKSYEQFRNVAKQFLLTPEAKSLKLTTISQKLSTKERKLLELRTQYNNSNKNFAGQLQTKSASSCFTTVCGETTRPILDKLMLLRPLNVYLQKEQAFKRKLRYYGTIPMRKLTVGNQSPYFKALMKRGFYYYKPSLRWKKTLYVASMRRGFRKKSRKQRILVMPTQQNFESAKFKSLGQFTEGELNTLSNLKRTTINNVAANTLSSEITNSIKNKINQISPIVPETNMDYSAITKATHSYTVLGKRASRYRHQIYKDVLQHWYYTPFNRLLLKFDVDAFINRQPKSHFLTKNEERMLHIRRFLLSEHYDTLRWYTYMQHYKTMKTNIGGTKSFANRIYNQQFQGTFKKIRHLFAITPKQGDLYTLKFDQPLYNDNKLKDNVYFHEELLTDNSPSVNYISKADVGKSAELTNNLDSLKSDGFTAYTSTLQKNINAADKKIDNLDVINQSSFLIGNQYLQQPTNNISQMASIGSLTKKGVPLWETAPASLGQVQQEQNLSFVYSELFVKLIKECKKRIHDQTFLKNYITHRIEKREQLNQEQTKELNKRLEKLKVWLNISQKSKTIDNYPLINATENTVLTTGMQKAINDSITNNKVKYTYGELTNAYTIKTEGQILNKLNVINSLTLENKYAVNVRLNSNLEKTKNLLKNTINKFKPILLGQTRLINLRTDKNLQWWRKKQRVITKRKNSRKRDRFKKQIAVVNKKLAALSKKVETEKSNLYKTLYGNYEISDYLLTNPQNLPMITDSTLLRKKQDNLLQTKQLQANSFVENTNLWQGGARLRKKISSKGRRYRSLSLARYLTATRKPRLVGLDGLTKIDNISNLKGSFLTKEEKQERLNLIIEPVPAKLGQFPEGEPAKFKSLGQFTEGELKKSQIKKRSRHSWKKRARHQFSRNHYKYRKRHIHGNGKLRVMNKKLKKFKATNELRQWWWNSFLPRYLNKLQTQRANPLGSPKGVSVTAVPSEINLLSGKKIVNNIAFKPLSNTNITIVPEIVRSNSNSRNLLDNLNSNILTQQEQLMDCADGVCNKSNNPGSLTANSSLQARSATALLEFNKLGVNLTTSDFIGQSQLGAKLQVSEGTNVTNTFSTNLTTTSLPFYAGWDDSLRKFVVTNRLLSRRDSGLAVKETNFASEQNRSPKGNNSIGLKSNTQEITFTNAPIQGLNEGSFLYWQTDMPFNSYNIDQFIATNQSSYAPLGWRRFEFRHSILKTWANNSKIFSTTKKNKTLIVSMKNLRPVIPSRLQKQEPVPAKLGLFPVGEQIKAKKSVARRIKKRYKLLKQMPNQLMYTPTGPLLTEVLPSHYISVFDQQYRFPRNRYLKRNTLKTLKKTTLLAMVDASNQTPGINKEFTLRKRVKPRRKYHRKRFIKKDGLIFPRRTKFTAFTSTFSGASEQSESAFPVGEDLRWRPSSRSKQKRKEGLRSKTKSNKRVKTNPLRLRQLRRREFQQVLKPIQRFIPINGGFAWPGDYLRLEVVEMPKLKSINKNSKSLKQKINVQPVGIMPRKYLIEKHNIKVLKKKLEKAYSSQQLNKAVKEYKNLIQNTN